MREHGLLPVIWCLAKCASRANTSFYYIDQHELFFSAENADKSKPDAELDLLIVSDGVARLVETKTSGKSIDISTTVQLARRLRPDMVTLAVMEAGSPALTAKVSELRRQLAGWDIATDLMTLEPGDIGESPILPTGTSYTIRVL